MVNTLIYWYSEGFKLGQDEMKKGIFEKWGNYERLNSHPTRQEIRKAVSFWDGYNDGGEAFQCGVKL